MFLVAMDDDVVGPDMYMYAYNRLTRSFSDGGFVPYGFRGAMLEMLSPI